MRITLTLAAAVLAICANGQDILFKDRTETFTNLQGQAYTKVRLIKADADGLIWMGEGASGGRVCYTNLAPAFLESLGISTDRIETAASRAAHRPPVAKFKPLTPQEVEAERRATEQRAKDQAELEISMQKASELEAMVALKLKIAAAQDQIRRSEVAVHDANWANLYNDAAPTYYVKESARYQVEQAQAQLSAMQAQFDAKWSGSSRATKSP